MSQEQLLERLQDLDEEVQVLRSQSVVSSPWITLQDVCTSTGLSRWTIWRKVKKGDFPTPCRPFPNVERWALAEVERWKREHLRSRRSDG